jgi:hypothetical protein
MDSTVTDRSRGVWLAAAIFVVSPWMSAMGEAQSQPTPRIVRYDGGRYDRAGAIVVGDGSAVHVVGSVEIGSSQPGFAALKFDRDGNRLWRTNYGGSAGGSLGQANGVAVDAQGNVYAAGYVSVGFHSTVIDALVVKFDANGVEQWARRYNGPGDGPDSWSNVVLDHAGNAYLSGYSYGSGIDWVIQKYAPNGSLVWTRRHSGPGAFDDVISDIQFSPDGNLLVTGTTKNRGDSVTNDITTQKYNPDGAVIWTTTYTGTAVSDDLVFDMAVDGAGSVYLSGAIAPTADPEGPLHVPLTLRYDGSGNLLRAVQEPASGNGMAIAIDPIGDVYVATESRLYKYDSTLTSIRSTPLAGNLWIAEMAVDSRSNVLIAATVFDPFTFVRDYYTTKLSSAGLTTWTHRFNGTGNRDDVVAGAALDPADDFIVTGTSWGNYVSSGGTADDIVSLRFLATDSGAPPSPPAAPGNLSANAASRSQIRLSWTDHSANETGFSIERCTGAGCNNFAPVTQVAAGVTTVVDSGLARRTTYRYRVRALGAAGNSAYSTIASATTPK